MIDDAEKLVIFDKLASVTKNSYFILNIHTNTLRWLNPMSEERLGYATDAIQTMSPEQLKELFHPDEHQLLRDSLEQIKKLRDGEFVSREYRLKDHLGTYHWIRDRVLPYRRNSTGEIEEVLALLTDITEKKEADIILSQTMEKLLASTKMAALGEMSGGIAHEINNPLTVIQARAFQMGQMVENNNLDPEKIKQAADSISRTADKIAKIIKSLRSFAREGTNDPFEVVPVRQIIDETLDFCRTRFYNHGVEVEVLPLDEDLEIECRLIQIEQVLLNLLNNSFDAIRDMEAKWVRIAVEESDDDINIKVIDSGSGLPEDIATKIMTPYFTTKGVGQGTGLGLSISSKIIQAHQGKLYNEKNAANTTFVIHLPKWQDTLEKD